MQRFLICLTLLSSCPVRAEPLTILIDPVITPTGIPTPQAEVPAAVSVIDAATIERSQASEIGELLRFTAGLEIARSGGPGGNTSLFIRGAESNHALVLLDGVPINPGTIGGAALQHLDPALFSRIEVVKGGRSALYGSEAIGGVVQLFTRRPITGSEWQASAGIGADAARQLRVSALTPQAGLSLAYQATDGFPAQQGGVDDHGYDNLGLTAYGDWKSLRATHWQANGEVEYQGFHPVTFAQGTLSQDFTNSATQLAWDAPVGTLRLSYVTDRIDQQDSSDFAHTDRWQADWQHHWRLNTQQLTLGVTLSDETTAARSFGTAYADTTTVAELWGQNLWQWGASEVQLALRLTDHETAGTEPSVNLAYGYDFGDVYAYTSLSRAFRAPDGTDRFGFGGNPDLKPEQAESVELGLRYELNAAQQLSANLFYSEIKDLISFNDPDGFFNPLPGRNENIDAARISGLELGYRYQAAPWTLALDAVLQDPKNADTEQNLARRSSRSLTASLVYVRPSWSVQGQCLLSSNRRDSDFSDETLAGYTVCHLSGEQRLAADWRLRARVENLFDRDYELADGFNTQGRALWMSLEYQHQ